MSWNPAFLKSNSMFGPLLWIMAVYVDAFAPVNKYWVAPMW